MKYLLTLLLAVTSLFGSAQIDPDGAKECVEKLRTGTLIVRLYYQSDKIELMQQEDPEGAEAYKAEVDRNNLAIRQAFANEYTAGRVYFINSDHSGELISGDWEGIIMNAEGETVEIPYMPYLVADISRSKNLGLEGLNIWDWDGEEWIHPPSPFPAYVSQYGFLGLYVRSYSEMVSKFNSNFVRD
ncbi:MAG: hypothetical protein HWE14_05240 [Flavobacteriia bacterium]|nr:hypothetical protein [Flavobacteriia bacterium]